MVDELRQEIEQLEQQSENLRRMDTSDEATAIALGVIADKIVEKKFRLGEQVFDGLKKKQKSIARKLTELRGKAEKQEEEIENSLTSFIESVRTLYRIEQQIKSGHDLVNHLSHEIAQVEGKSHQRVHGYVISKPWQRSKPMPGGLDAWPAEFIKHYFEGAGNPSVDVSQEKFELTSLERECLEILKYNQNVKRQHDTKAENDAENERRRHLPHAITIRGQMRCAPVQALEAVCDLHGVDDIQNADASEKIQIERELTEVMKHYRLLPRDVRDIDKIFSQENIEKWSS